uniref:uncharacterized protein LOC122592217 n=1 Tax=Erigeron canadensis TaxID=72917 RepID=UPI001CB8BFBB|nr:uncharacterized protein LOC122592217 [Erigeron canadensis]
MAKHKDKKLRENWPDPWVLSLCAFLNEYITKHGRSSTFKWVELQPEFEKIINHTFPSKGALKNKYDNMKKDYNLWKSLKNGEIGLGWDESTKTLICSDDWWKKKIKENSKYRKLQSKQPSIELQEAWDQLFADAVASGVNCVASSMDPSGVNEVFIENLEDDDVVSGEEVDAFQANNGYSSRLENLERQEDEFFEEFLDGVNGDRASTSNKSGVLKQVNKHTKKMSTKLKPVKMKRKGRESSGTTMLKDHQSQSNANQQELIQILKSDASGDNKTSKFSIEAAVSIIGRMVEEEKMMEGDNVWMFAIDLFEDPIKREIFISLLNDNRRLDWLLHKQNSLD